MMYLQEKSSETNKNTRSKYQGHSCRSVVRPARLWGPWGCSQASRESSPQWAGYICTILPLQNDFVDVIVFQINYIFLANISYTEFYVHLCELHHHLSWCSSGPRFPLQPRHLKVVSSFLNTIYCLKVVTLRYISLEQCKVLSESGPYSVLV